MTNASLPADACPNSPHDLAVGAADADADRLHEGFVRAGRGQGQPHAVETVRSAGNDGDGRDHIECGCGHQFDLGNSFNRVTFHGIVYFSERDVCDRGFGVSPAWPTRASTRMRFNVLLARVAKRGYWNRHKVGEQDICA